MRHWNGSNDLDNICINIVDFWVVRKFKPNSHQFLLKSLSFCCWQWQERLNKMLKANNQSIKKKKAKNVISVIWNTSTRMRGKDKKKKAWKIHFIFSPCSLWTQALRLRFFTQFHFKRYHAMSWNTPTVVAEWNRRRWRSWNFVTHWQFVTIQPAISLWVSWY